MTTRTEIDRERTATDIKQLLLDQKCWYVACGGSVGATFQLALGRKVRRAKALSNPAASAEFRESEGERGLLVWCSWRLDRPDIGMTSSEDETDSRRDGALRSLTGTTIRSVSIENDWLLRVVFDDSSELKVFPDNVGPSAVIDTNWEAWSRSRSYAIDSELACLVRRRRGSKAGALS